MQITLNSFRQNENDISVYFTLTDGVATFRWHADIPVMAEAAIQFYLESKMEQYRCGLYRKCYPDAEVIRVGAETELQAWQRVVAGLPPVTTTPAAKEAEKMTAIVANLPSWQQVSNAIDAATTVAQLRAIVKKLARVTYWLAKNQED